MRIRKTIALFMLFCLCCVSVCPYALASNGADWDAKYGNGEVAGDYMGTWTVANCKTNVTLREWPSTKANKVTTVPKWAEVEAYYYNTDWFECYYNGKHGYIHRDYLTDRPGKYPDWPGNSSYSGGGSSDRYDLDDYGYRTVSTKGRGALVFQSSPGGSFLKNFSFRDGDTIYVNLTWRQNGYAIAYSNGTYGYVDASYINWGNSGGGSKGSPDATNLDYFEYRTVNTKGRGALVFQSSPGGSFMKNYKFWDGDWIYVNVSWRKNGYAIAYEDGVYGYVDASYINW